MHREIHVPARRGIRFGRLAACVLVVAAALTAVIAAHAVPFARAPRPAAGTPAAVVRPQAATRVLSGSPSAVSVAAARLLFASSPVVIVASQQAGLSGAARLAQRLHAPVLLSGAGVADSHGSPRSASSEVGAGLRSAIRALRARAVLALGLQPGPLAAALPGVKVVTAASALPAALRKLRLEHSSPRTVALLVRSSAAAGAAALAARATTQAAGARVIEVSGYDPRADPAAISALAAARPGHVLAIGTGFGPAARLAARVAAAETGVQLPGGGQVLFQHRMIVALYGSPVYPALGALGEQSLPASIARAKRMAAPYQALTRARVVPGFEIIATVASRSPGRDGDYSYQTPLPTLRRWVSAATAAGMYVILDLQPGRASLLTQAKIYAPLLKLPDVGLALDPEWKLQAGQLPLHQIGSVSIAEVNQVVSWLANLTARYRLPQKLLELHEFRLSMITDEQHLDTRNSDLAIIVNMDGQGTPGDKQQTWQAVTGAAPRGVSFGWKNFLVKDHPMLTPGQTMSHTPVPVLISYQ